MKKRLLLAAVAVTTTVMATDESFDVLMELLAPIQITEVKNLQFPATLSGAALDVVVATGDTGAAEFSATGTASKSFTKSVVESSITLQLDGNSGGLSTKEIVVDTFSLAGPVAFDGSGNATGLKVGGTAHVLAEDLPGQYSGVATFRMVYN